MLHIDVLRQGFTWSDTDCVNTRAAPLCQQSATTATTDPAITTTTASATTTTTAPTTTTTEGSLYDCTGDKQKRFKYLCYKSEYLDWYRLFQFPLSTDWISGDYGQYSFCGKTNYLPNLERNLPK